MLTQVVEHQPRLGTNENHPIREEMQSTILIDKMNKI